MCGDYLYAVCRHVHYLYLDLLNRQVAFRAKVGKQYQLPHKGIIPEEFGVVCLLETLGSSFVLCLSFASLLHLHR